MGLEKLSLSTGVVFAYDQVVPTMQEKVVNTVKLAKSVAEKRGKMCGIELTPHALSDLVLIPELVSKVDKNIPISLHAPNMEDVGGVGYFETISGAISEILRDVAITSIVLHSDWIKSEEDCEQWARLSWASSILIEGDDIRTNASWRDEEEVNILVGKHGLGGSLFDIAHISEREARVGEKLGMIANLPTTRAYHWSWSDTPRSPHVSLSSVNGELEKRMEGAQFRPGATHVIESPLGLAGSEGVRLQRVMAEIAIIEQFVQ